MRHLIAYAFVFAAVFAATATAEDDPLAPYLWEARPVIVFADSPKDPRFVSQVERLHEAAAEMAERDVILLTDTDPAANGSLRQRLHPRDFQILLIGKDGQIKYRRPHPVSAEDVIRQIDRMPMRRREMQGGQG